MALAPQRRRIFLLPLGRSPQYPLPRLPAQPLPPADPRPPEGRRGATDLILLTTTTRPQNGISHEPKCERHEAERHLPQRHASGDGGKQRETRPKGLLKPVTASARLAAERSSSRAQAISSVHAASQTSFSSEPPIRRWV